MTNEADLISTSLRMLAALAIVMAALILLYYFVKRRFSAENGRAKGNLIRVIANTYIGLKKTYLLSKSLAPYWLWASQMTVFLCFQR
ncbi:MAG: hypothetical protein V2J25_16490 [Desulfatiglans sp.]|jgi:flagellar biogenesis protein FliO|nr:hypothetical protein [Desulfatiglans sp.]